MNTHSDETQENKSQTVTAEASQMQSGGESTFQFVDNRPEAVAQRKLQEMANNSPQVSQQRAFQDMANSSPQAKQAAQFQVIADNRSAKQQQPIQKKENNTGLPDNLKTGIENLSGMSLDDVKVHKNSDKPAQLQAHAYAQGTDIHLGPGQEKHLPHEAWHVVQQKQGRVKPTMQMKGKVNVNDNAGLEKEANVMGEKALQINEPAQTIQKFTNTSNTTQLAKKVGVVFGISHLVKMMNGSLYADDFRLNEDKEITSGDLLEIDKDSSVRSRRGPNQEDFNAEDNKGLQHYVWFKVLTLNQEVLDDNIYVREDVYYSVNSELEEETQESDGGIDDILENAEREENPALEPSILETVTMNADQGPQYALGILKKATAEYVLAVRMKEELRTELGVSKLKKAKKKDLTDDQSQRIDEVRTKKSTAIEHYKRNKKIVGEYLKERPSESMLAQIADIDKAYSFARAMDKSESVKAISDKRVKAQGASKKLGIVTDTLVLTEGRFGELKRSVSQIAAAGVASSNKSASFSVSFQVGIKKASNITAKLGLGYSGSLNIQDDRKFRVSHSLALSAGVSTELAGVFSASLAGELSGAKTEVFTDIDHWAATMSFRINSLIAKIRQLDDLEGVQKTVTEEFDGETAHALLQTGSLAEDESTKVSATKLSGAAEASALGFGAKRSKDKTWMTFNKGGKEKKATQDTKTYVINLGSNVSLNMTWTNISNHANPDNDGDYFNFKIEASGKIAGILQGPAGDPVYDEWEQSFRNAFDASAAIDKGFVGNLANTISSNLSINIAELENTKFTLEGSSSMGAEWNFVKTNKSLQKEGYRLQYRRISETKGLSASGSVPVGSVGAASVSLGLSASKSQSSMVSEKLGDSTLTYLLTVFNGLHAADARDAEKGIESANRWDAYVTSHKFDVWSAMKSLKAGKGAAPEVVKNIIEATAKTKPDNVEQDDWKPIETKKDLTRINGTALLDSVRGLNLSAEGPDSDDAWTNIREALSNYFDAQGDLNKALSLLDWE